MIVTVTSKRQVTFPKQVMERLHLRPGDTLLISETEEGILIKPNRFETEGFAPLRGKVDVSLPEPDHEAIRHAALDENLRS